MPRAHKVNKGVSPTVRQMDSKSIDAGSNPATPANMIRL